MPSLMLFQKKKNKVFAVILMAECFMTCPSLSQVSPLKVGCCMQTCLRLLGPNSLVFVSFSSKSEIINSMYWVFSVACFRNGIFQSHNPRTI